MTGATAHTFRDGRRTGLASVPLRTLSAALVALFALDNVLLLRLLGVSPAIVIALAVIAPVLLAVLIVRMMPSAPRISGRTIIACFALALALLALGGEGRLFYATPDWQIRDAVLADMGLHRWPFDYWLNGQAQLLRAPVGMYLVPAIIGGASQAARDWALLGHNAVVLTLILAQGAVLFETQRARIIALAVFVMFSGLDIAGTLFRLAATGNANWLHLEQWAGGYQYSSHITQIFWVPQHAFAGWSAALAYVLWRKGMAPIGVFAATLPLVAIWSPLILFGALPFAVFAGFRALMTGKWCKRDVLLSVFALLLALPALAYLSTGTAAMGGGARTPDPLYLLFVMLEVTPFLLPLLRWPDRQVDRATTMIIAACLILMPLWTIGMSNDFQMRASIMPLALLAMGFAQWAIALQTRVAKIGCAVLLALGAVTGAVEMARAFLLAPSPIPRCSLAGVWYRQTGMVVAPVSYFAPISSFAGWIQPVERVAPDPAACWDRGWSVPKTDVAEQKDHR